ncbi:hypothetical protein B0H65DRAFT_589099 [Neurospora tetraspora]|uniref:Uncharacterized protein n=1 Tax=Neurospora tetraspora TaxID=94610 RepID=A0AAE0MRZ6_9PEZI|nr:hypothetical protein B0H65DRAFT_589099 [Neurospora tetraspora]
MPTLTGSCKDPAQCQLSPEISNALQRFSIPHTCRFAEAKRQLVDKIIDDVLDKRASSIAAVLQQEFLKWEDETKENGKRSG